MDCEGQCWLRGDGRVRGGGEIRRGTPVICVINCHTQLLSEFPTCTPSSTILQDALTSSLAHLCCYVLRLQLLLNAVIHVACFPSEFVNVCRC